jgi:hypothetical protein
MHAFGLLLAFAAMVPGADSSPALPLTPFVEMKTNGAWRCIAAKRVGTELERASFQAVVEEVWPAGLVPIFAVETKNRLELRRLPARGTEQHVEPLFFALAPEHEPLAGRIAGRWDCIATNSQNNTHQPNWELTVDGDRVRGRFDPQSEYRVAFIAGGTFRSNRLELTTEYFNDRYFLVGEWRNGQITGTWRQHDDTDRGTWLATRPHGRALPASTNTVPLYEWSRGDARRYSTAAKLNEPGWTRAALPLCRVWRGR